MMIAPTRKKTKKYLTTGMGHVVRLVTKTHLKTVLFFHEYFMFLVVYTGAGERKVDVANAHMTHVFTNKCKFANAFSII